MWRSAASVAGVKRLMSSSSSSRGRIAAVWGNGDFGRLGHGGLDSQWRPKPLVFLNDVASVSCGGAHTLFLTESGKVYATGLNDYGQLGIPDDKMYTVEPTLVPGLPEGIVQICAGYYHSCAITADGGLYMWGKNTSGQLGLGKKASEVVSVPTKVECLTGISVKTAALGSDHSIAVTEEGSALSWGGGGAGRLGHELKTIFGILSSNSEYTPRLIKNLEGMKVKKVAAGMMHSACIDENGSVFFFGEKALSKLGFSARKDAATPSMVAELPCSEDVVCGGYHTCVITSGGELYTWGSNENGCLGTGSTNVFHQPERVEGPFLRSPVSKVSCGWKHTAAISDGRVFTWGWGGANGTFSEEGHSSGGQLGHGDDVDYTVPVMVSFDSPVRALHVSCGFNHTGAILECGEA
ncbi:hypothetical protein MLD38_020447 [Melastoma candidum]|uniref:Uncharacterized protein n=1 Tax=Melastoma candidum TaxID=119954 RepID=A0ACB9QGR5_9MYRT|nr:hypothetical protein MLD38_020447 [Melastoma candidum]